ncbi:NB-ARC domain-containing protein [Kibdelosporangium philippinense]|uniref:NB-ARC domain-containing protein n=2 Tax=Kibdelosporangium philippinense TaxID=211113 RepID=A0ABS8Z2N8_9PSEU|nr:NB-ARC domain-containing protein [Kibdelosporangium philippinense]MCE7002209.1 NB-ARC domain-containing protein [Kibdelosporangium philippinense]
MVPGREQGNLPADVSSFMGRRSQIDAARRMLSETRLLTLTGAGGVGKTRLALRIAQQVRRAYEDGVWLVELAALAQPELLTQVTAATLGIRDRTRRPPLDVLVRYLADKQMLLVLDNCEHLMDACTALIGQLLPTAAGLRILVTSRQSLGIPGEHILRVPSLSLPAPGHTPQLSKVSDYDAITLFTERAATACPTFTADPGSLVTVVDICRRLDGLPLAIELAAARMRTLSAECLLERLDDWILVLANSSGSAPPRHRTLRATIDWSFGLCPTHSHQTRSVLTHPDRRVGRRTDTPHCLKRHRHRRGAVRLFNQARKEAEAREQNLESHVHTHHSVGCRSGIPATQQHRGRWNGADVSRG